MPSSLTLAGGIALAIVGGLLALPLFLLAKAGRRAAERRKSRERLRAHPCDQVAQDGLSEPALDLAPATASQPEGQQPDQHETAAILPSAVGATSMARQIERIEAALDELRSGLAGVRRFLALDQAQRQALAEQVELAVQHAELTIDNAVAMRALAARMDAAVRRLRLHPEVAAHPASPPMAQSAIAPATSEPSTSATGLPAPELVRAPACAPDLGVAGGATR